MPLADQLHRLSGECVAVGADEQRRLETTALDVLQRMADVVPSVPQESTSDEAAAP